MEAEKKRISVLVSGGGTNFQALIDNIENDKIKNGIIVQLISNNKNAYAIKRAEKHGIKWKYIGKKSHPDQNDRTKALIQALDEEKTDLVVLAGYMSILAPEFISRYRNRIINIHPSLIPKHCGPGMYGIHVHEDVIRCGDNESGATVHYVDEGVDTGEIILQDRVPVYKNDTPESLAARVLKIEHILLPKAVRMYCDGEL